MKLHCNVEINNRLSTTNVVRRKSQRSILAIGKQTVKNTEIYILWQTLQNKQGTKYKVNNCLYIYIYIYILLIIFKYICKWQYCYLKYIFLI